jgi:SAM-dependent methyltransferase
VDLEVTTHFMTDEELMVWLADSSLCAFLYEDPKPGAWRGLSSVLDYALAANVPIAVSRSPMFRHVTRAEPSVCIEDRTLKGIMESGTTVLDVYRERWSHGNLIKRYEEVISTCLAGLGEPASRGSSGTRTMPVNCFLKSQAEIVSATTTLQAMGAPTNTACPPKNWDLLASLSHVSGRVLDLGSGTDGSFFLKACNHLKLGIERWGIDIEASPPVEGSQIIVGDLMHTPFRDAYFQTLVCLSVVEHGVDDKAFAAECGRLLSPGGKLVVSFDAWEPKVDTSQRTIYGLPWKVFGREEIESLVSTLAVHDLRLTSPVDWALGDAVIYPGYFSPFNGVQYTFCVLVLEKR